MDGELQNVIHRDHGATIPVAEVLRERCQLVVGGPSFSFPGLANQSEFPAGGASFIDNARRERQLQYALGGS